MSYALILGASGGIGSAISKRLQHEGWEPFVITRSPDPSLPQDSTIDGVDFSNAWEVEQAVVAASQRIDDVDLWVYAAGDISTARVDSMQEADWRRVLNANLTGPYLAAKYSMPLLSESAHMFFIGAITERLILPGFSAYAASKAGLEAFAEILAKEERKKRVTVVRPPAVATSFWNKVPLRQPAGALSPEIVADRILEAYQARHTGPLLLKSSPTPSQ